MACVGQADSQSKVAQTLDNLTNAVFAAHVRRVWRYSFTAADRAALTAYLARGGYDPTQEELMVNESMAYLLFTPDDRFFAAAEVGLSESTRLPALS